MSIITAYLWGLEIVQYVLDLYTPCWFMAEFFILKEYRNQGIASEVVNQALKLHKGEWHIGVIIKNKRALSFWEKVLPIESITNSILRDHEEEVWKIFKIES